MRPCRSVRTALSPPVPVSWATMKVLGVTSDLVGRASAIRQLFDVFVPPEALADDRPQFPSGRLRGLVDCPPQRLQTLADDAPVRGVELRGALEGPAAQGQGRGPGPPH